MAFQVLTMTNIVYLAFDNDLFASKCHRFAEIASEMLLLLLGLALQSHLAWPNQSDRLSMFVLIVFGLLTVINLGTLVYTVVTSCKAKSREKKLAKVRARRAALG